MLSILASMICSRRSGDVSISKLLPRVSTQTETRRRRFFGLSGSALPQISPEGPPGKGTPPDPPLPKIVTRMT